MDMKGHELFLKKPMIGEIARRIYTFRGQRVMLEAGATFMTSTPRDYCGSMLDNIHFDPAVRHYAYVLPMHVRLTASEARE